MKIPIENNEEKEAWREKLDHNIEVMEACIAAFPDQNECVWRALFDSVVPSASQGGLTGYMEEALKLLEDNKPEPVTFHGIMPPGVFEGGGPAVLDDPPEPPPPEIKPPAIPAAIKPPAIPDDGSVCWLCGSCDLLQAVHLPELHGTPESPLVTRYVCMECIRTLVLSQAIRMKKISNGA